MASKTTGCCLGCSGRIVGPVEKQDDVYINPPVVLVVLEVRHPAADPLTISESKEIRSLLADLLPIHRPGKQTTVEMVGSASPEVSVESFPRYMDRDSTLAVSFRQEAMVIEASRYLGWESFKDVAMRALDARMAVAPVAGVERLGLRYINEVRASDSTMPTQWADWVHHSLLGPMPDEPVDLPLSQWQGVAVYGEPSGCTLVLRYGPRTGFALDPSSDMRRVKTPDGGPFFLLDLDSSWTSGGSVPEVDRNAIRSRCDELHAPVRTLFDGMTKDQLKEEVFRRGR